MPKDASNTRAWEELKAISSGSLPSIGELNLRSAGDQARIVEGAGLTLDFSRQRVDDAALALLVQLAEEVELRERIIGMYRGDIANPTEQREVLHTALRRKQAPHAREVGAERERMLTFADAVRTGSIRSSNGDRFERVINVGIGGSDLGPAMAVQALHQFTDSAPRIDFVSNVDGSRLADLLAVADARRTLFIVCSKTFTTLETRCNAESARRWLADRLGAMAVPDHFAAVSVNSTAMDQFGIHPDYRFAMWDWVGGRYSIWSSIGVSLAVAIGSRNFNAFRAGGAAMDEHFSSAPWRGNLPALLGLLGVWNIEFLKLPTLAVLPYDDRLARFPAYLQQLDMESNGKRVRIDGSAVFSQTAPVIWGEPGNNAQHSFFQMLHQGTPRAALDFLLPALSSCSDQAAHDLAIVNCLAQAEAFAYGQESDHPHKVHEGNRPSSVIFFKRLDPATLGALVALYEHKVFTQSVIWGINAFDQWGVELGKKLATKIAPMIAGAGNGARGTLGATLASLRSLRGQ